MKEVLIEIKGMQQLPEGEPDITTLTTTGSVQKNEEELIISYGESEMIGAKNVKTKITVTGDTATIKRSGGMESQLVIQKGKRHSCLYNTAQGDFLLGIYGESLLTQITEDGGKIYMSYTIDVYSSLLSKNIMEIKFKEI